MESPPGLRQRAHPNDAGHSGPSDIGTHRTGRQGRPTRTGNVEELGKNVNNGGVRKCEIEDGNVGE